MIAFSDWGKPWRQTRSLFSSIRAWAGEVWDDWSPPKPRTVEDCRRKRIQLLEAIRMSSKVWESIWSWSQLRRHWVMLAQGKRYDVCDCPAWFPGTTNAQHTQSKKDNGKFLAFAKKLQGSLAVTEWLGISNLDDMFTFSGNFCSLDFKYLRDSKQLFPSLNTACRQDILGFCFKSLYGLEIKMKCLRYLVIEIVFFTLVLIVGCGWITGISYNGVEMCYFPWTILEPWSVQKCQRTEIWPSKLWKHGSLERGTFAIISSSKQKNRRTWLA